MPYDETVYPDTASVGAVPLSFRDIGDPSGAPVVLLHALGNTGRTWDAFATELAARGRRVIVPDLRGHGRSPRPGHYTYALMREDVTALLDRQGVGTVDLVGHSMGGHIAWLIAQHRPGRVRRLVIEDAPPPPRDAAGEAALRARTAHAGGQPVMALFQEFLDLRRARGMDRGAIRPVIDGLRSPDPVWWRKLPLVTAETLVVSGGPGSPVSRSLLAEVAATVPRGSFLAIDAGHYVHRTEPERFGAAVTAFLR